MLAFLFFLILRAHAGPSCSRTKLTVGYINGINTPIEKANRTANVIDEIFKTTQLDEQGYEFVSASSEGLALYNSSVSLRSDLVEAVYFKLREMMGGAAVNPSIVEKGLARFFVGPIKFAEYMRDLGLDVRPVLDVVVKPLLQDGAISDREKFIAKLSSKAMNGEKILLVGHSEGTLYVNMVLEALKNLPSDNRLRSEVFGSLLLAPAASFLNRNSVGAVVGEYVLNSVDFVIGGVTALPSNVLIGNFETDPSGHDVLDTYLNEGYTRTMDGVRATMVQHFQRKTQSVLSKLVSNRDGCCGDVGSRGSLWNNDNPECEATSSCCTDGACIGGFVENGIRVAREDKLKVENGSLVCKQTPQAKPLVDGAVRLAGKISLGASVKVIGATHSSHLVDIDSGDGAVHLGPGTTLQQAGPADLELRDDLVLSNTRIIGAGRVHGTRQSVGFRTSIADAVITGDSIDMTGSFVLRANAHNPRIAGDFVTSIFLSAPWNYMHILPGANIDGGRLQGIGRIEGRVGGNSIANGFKVGETINGIQITSDSSLMGESEVRGSVLVNGSHLDNHSLAVGDRPGLAYDFWVILRLHFSNMDNSTFKRAGTASSVDMKDSLVAGCEMEVAGYNLVNSQVYGWDNRPMNYSGATHTGATFGSPSEGECPDVNIPNTKEKYAYLNVPDYWALRGQYPIPDECGVFGCVKGSTVSPMP